jgi:hypothetical protein
MVDSGGPLGSLGNWNCALIPSKGVPKAQVILGRAPPTPELTDKLFSSGAIHEVTPLAIVNTLTQRQPVRKHNANMSSWSSDISHELCVTLDVMAEETGFQGFVARNVWEKCRDIETTQLVLQAMKEAANNICATAIGTTPIL